MHGDFSAEGLHFAFGYRRIVSGQVLPEGIFGRPSEGREAAERRWCAGESAHAGAKQNQFGGTNLLALF